MRANIDRKSPQKALLSYCRHCVGSKAEVENCEDTQCPFWPYRLGDKRPPVKVFRKFCLQCTCGSTAYIRECPSTHCPVFPYRFGTNPARAQKRQKVVTEKGVFLQDSLFDRADIGEPILQPEKRS